MLPTGRGRGRGRATAPDSIVGSFGTSSAGTPSTVTPGGLQARPVAVQSRPSAHADASLANREQLAVRQRMDMMRIESSSGPVVPMSSTASTPSPPRQATDGSLSPAISTSGVFSSSPSTASTSGTPAFGFGRRAQRGPPMTTPVQAKLPRRPNFGKAGVSIDLVTNHFVVKVPNVKFYHYDVSVVDCTVVGHALDWAPGRVPRFPRCDVQDRCYDVFAKWAHARMGMDFFALIYDKQQHLYSSIFIGRKIDDRVELGDKCYRMVVRPAASSPFVTVSMDELCEVAYEKPVAVDQSPTRILELLHSQMLYYMKWLNKAGYTQNGRCFYNDDRRTIANMPMGRELKDGFVKSLRLVNGTNADVVDPRPVLSLNVDAKMSPFHKAQNLEITASEILAMDFNRLGKDGLSRSQIDLLKLHLQDVRVQAVHNRRVFVIVGVTEKPACKETFIKDGQRTTVVEHFYQIGSPLKYPLLPCVKDDKKSMFPLEKCVVIRNQKVDLPKLTAEQSSLIIKKAAVPPEVRKQRIVEKSNELMGQDDNFLKRLGFERSKKMMEIKGRVLSAPLVSYANRKVTVRAGSWQLGQCKLSKPATIDSFVIICLEKTLQEHYINPFKDGLLKQARQMGMQVPNDCAWGDYRNADEVLTVLDECKRQHNVNFVVVVLPDKMSAKARGEVKFAEKETEVVTQCLAPKTLKKYYDRPDAMLLENIVLKLNLKCGGLNNELSLVGDPVGTKWIANDVMFVGFDVNHPAPLSRREIAMGMLPKKPSVVGAVANAGPSVHEYFMVPKVQDPRREEISRSNIEAAFERFVMKFTEYRGAPPKRVVVYRDGVSESQFEMVQNRETLAIKNALAKFGCSAAVTMITVQKRHNTRFFRKDDQFQPRARNAEKNIPAGTVIDTGPVGPFLFDFFLASHAGIQGTTKAPYFVVIHDDNRFEPDELQRLSFLLAHVYQRAAKSVSLPAPCYFAHHAATRGKELAEGFLNISDETSSGVSSQSDGSGSTNSGKFILDYDEINKRIDYSLDFGCVPIFL